MIAGRGAQQSPSPEVFAGSIAPEYFALADPGQEAAISILAPGWRLREFGEERARQIVEAVARQLALRASG